MKRTDLIALAERLKPMAAAPVFDGIDVAALADFLRQIAESQPVGTVAQNSFDQYQAAFDGRGIVTPWMRKGPHAAPLLFRELEVGTALYTLPLED